MNVDLSRLPAGTAGWLSLVHHALELGDLSEVDYLELKGTLAFTDRPQRRRSAVVVSRAILGMANRMPNVAERHLGGFGVIFVGISQEQTVDGAEEVDGAVLRDLVQSNVGEDGPRWDHQYIKHPDGLVLAVVVDPPQWGDSIRACRREYSDDATKLAVRDGDVFVRLPGKTRLATSHDLSQLELRRSRAPHTGAQVHVEYVGAFDRTSRAGVSELVEKLVWSAADHLLKGLPAPGPGSPYGVRVEGLLGGFSVPADRRRPEAFRDQVDAWIDECREATDAVVTEFLRHHLPRGTFAIVNDSDRYLEGVRVQVSFPRCLAVLMASDTDYCDHGGKFDVFRFLPERPPRYGHMELFGLGGLPASALAQFRHAAAEVESVVDQTEDGGVVSWFVGDLPPRGRGVLDEEIVLYADEEQDRHSAAEISDHEPTSTEVRADWRVTARGIDHVFRGELPVACRQEPGVVLVWRQHGDS